MMRSTIGQVLGRVSVVDYEGATIYDTFVCYPERITITNTNEKFSGIRWDDTDPQNGAQDFSKVQAHLAKLLRGCIVVGHDVEKDLKAIKMHLPAHLTLKMSVRDTQKYSGYCRYANPGAHQGPNLKVLAREVLGREIKLGRVSSVEDAVATMEIYRKVEVEIDHEQGK